MDAMSDPKRYGENWIEGFSGSAVPSIVNAIAKMTDDKRREVSTPWEAMKYRTPYLSMSLLPKRDIWGREILHDGGWAQRGFSPVMVGEETKDAVDREMVRLYKQSKFAPGLPQRKIAGEKLTPAQYDLYLNLSGQVSYGLVERVIKSDEYKAADDEAKADTIKRMIERGRKIGRKGMTMRGTQDYDALVEQLRQEGLISKRVQTE
jgi:hypothetical protein